MPRLLLALCLMCVVRSGHAKRVLLVSCQALSHMRELNYVGDELKLMGHEVYQVINSKFNSIDKVTKSGIEPIMYNTPDDTGSMSDMLTKVTRSTNIMEGIFAFTPFLNDDCRHFMEDKAFLNKVKDMNFDLMIVDGFLLAPCRFILPHHLGVPYVYQSSVGLTWLLRHPSLPSFQPILDPVANIDFSNTMTFWQRTANLILTVVSYNMIPIPFTKDTRLLDEYAPGQTWDDLILKSELFLVTRDHMLEYPTVELPNLITAPGITLEPSKPLPASIEKIFQTATHGVVLVSFGSLAQGISDEAVDNVFEAVSKLKQTVVMRFADDIEAARKKAPANVHLLSWIPQNDILGHNKTVAFVTHCGNNGQYESLYHGVPMVGIPIFAEQFHNAFRVTDHGYGLQVKSMAEFTSAELLDALTEVINNPQYRENTKHASAIIKEQKLPRAKLAYWVDHVLKFGGKHLRPSCQDLPLYKLLMLDVLAFLSVVSLVALYLLRGLVRACCSKCCSKKAGKAKDD